MALAYHHLYGLDVAMLRIANPFGPFQLPDRGQGFVAKAMHRAMHRRSIEIWSDGSVIRDFAFIDDVVDAILAAATRQGYPGPLNIGSGVGRSLRTYSTSAVRPRRSTGNRRNRGSKA